MKGPGFEPQTPPKKEKRIGFSIKYNIYFKCRLSTDFAFLYNNYSYLLFFNKTG